MFNLLSTLICTTLLSVNSAATSLSPEPKILPFKATALVAQQNRIWVTIEKPQMTRIAVILRAPNHAVLFQELLKKSQKVCLIKLDMSGLADGIYELEVKSTDGIISKQVKLITIPEESQTRQISMK